MLKETIIRLIKYFTGACSVAAMLVLYGCGGGENGDRVENSENNSNSSPEARTARLLSINPVSRIPDLIASPSENVLLNQIDQQAILALSSTVISGRYSNTISRLVARTHISSLNAFVVGDLACTSSPVGGGLAGVSVLYLDGKLLDMMAELANALALVESGRMSATLSQIVDTAAAQQLSFSRFCVSSDPIAYPDAMLTQSELNRSVEIFTQLVGGIVFHEFGHIWGQHALLRIRDSIVSPYGGFFTYTSVLEDNADVIAGILSAKSNHDPIYPKIMVDLMTFTYFYRRTPGSVFYAQTLGWQGQYQQLEPTHSSSATRKLLISRGYQGWANK